MRPIATNIWERVGYCPAVAATEYAVSAIAAAYVYPTAAMQMEVVSSDNTNDKASGTGALTVEIIYLDSTYKEKRDVVTLNGTTVVPTTATDIFRVNSFKVLTAGTSGAAAGKIDLRHLSDTPIYASIAIGQTEARQLIYTVPAGQKLIIDELYLSNTATTALKYSTFALKNNIAAGSAIFENRFLLGLDQSTANIYLENPIVVPEKRDIKGIVLGVATGIFCATVRGRLEG